MSPFFYAGIGLVLGLGIAGLVGYWFNRRLNRRWERTTGAAYVVDTLGNLEKLRSGDAQGAIKSNEMLLDVGVMRLGQQLALLPRQRRSSDDLYWLQRAKEYRQKCPRSSGVPEVDAEVARSFRLLET